MTAEAQRSNFRAFLDGVQYSRTGILRYERIFGPGFVSTGGFETTKVSPLEYPLQYLSVFVIFYQTARQAQH